MGRGEEGKAIEAIEAMLVHQGAHAMWMPEADALQLEPDGAKDCPTCGLTLVGMYQGLARGVYTCAFSQRNRRVVAE